MKKNLKLLLLLTAVALLAAGAAVAKKYRLNTGTWIGVAAQSVDYDLVEALDLGVDYGVIVNKVYDDSPAEKAKLEEGDVIVGLNSTKITDYDDLIDALDEHEAGDEVTLKTMRDGQNRDVKVVLEKTSRKRNRYIYSGDGHRNIFTFRDNGDDSYIGVRLSDLNKQLGTYFGVEKGRGALVSEVIEDSPAEEAGLLAGDVIVAMDNEKVYEGDDVVDYVDDTDVGENITFKILRDRKEMEISVEVGEGNDDYYFGDNGHFRWYGAPDIPSIPAIPAMPAMPAMPSIDIRVPSGHYLHHSDFSDFDELEELFEEGELQEELKELRQELKKMQRELKEELSDIRSKLD